MNDLLALDEKLLLLINGWHNDGLDFFFSWVSEKWIWVPVYAVIFYLYYKNFPGRIIHIAVLAAILILLCDQTASHVFKLWIMRLRPCHVPGLAEKIHIVNNYCGGTYGFVSSHAANTFGLAVFFSATLGKKYRAFAIALFCWALLISFSRVYLGVHYPGDVIGGALVGIFFAWLILKFSKPVFLVHTAV
jgi:undecaprenyl-diphosphatase